MTHGHFRSCLRFPFAELKKLAIHILSQKIHFYNLCNDKSLPRFSLIGHVYEFFPEGHPQRFGVTVSPYKIQAVVFLPFF